MIPPRFDFQRAQDYLENVWEKHCPLIVYVPKEEGDDPDDDIWGRDLDGEEEIDDLWGSDLDEDSEEEEEKELHSWLRAWPLADPNTDQLGKLGVWNENDFLFVLLKVQVEEVIGTIQNGDCIVFDERIFRIVEVLRWGFWRESSEYLLVILNCAEVPKDKD